MARNEKFGTKFQWKRKTSSVFHLLLAHFVGRMKTFLVFRRESDDRDEANIIALAANWDS